MTDEPIDDLSGAPIDEVPSFIGGDAPITAFTSDEVLMIEPTATLREAAQLCARASVGFIVVGEPTDVDGVISERDIVRAVAERINVDTTTVAEVESHTLMWTTPDATVGEVAEEMMEEYVRHVLVGEDKRLVGIVSMRDILAAYLD